MTALDQILDQIRAHLATSDAAARAATPGELPPCPFCGGEATMTRGILNYAGCKTCHINQAHYYEHKAIAAWNTRAASPAAVLRMNAAVRELVEAVEEIATDLYPPTDNHGYCLECGNWTPRNHAEAHDHEDTCQANLKYEKRRNPRSVALAALQRAAERLQPAPAGKEG